MAAQFQQTPVVCTAGSSACSDTAVTTGGFDGSCRPRA